MSQCAAANIVRTVWPETQASSSRGGLSWKKSSRFANIEGLPGLVGEPFCYETSSLCPLARDGRLGAKPRYKSDLSAPPLSAHPLWPPALQYSTGPVRLHAPRARPHFPSTISTCNSDRKACTTCSPIDSTTGNTESNAYQSPTMSVRTAPFTAPNF